MLSNYYGAWILYVLYSVYTTISLLTSAVFPGQPHTNRSCEATTGNLRPAEMMSHACNFGLPILLLASLAASVGTF